MPSLSSNGPAQERVLNSAQQTVPGGGAGGGRGHHCAAVQAWARKGDCRTGWVGLADTGLGASLTLCPPRSPRRMAHHLPTARCDLPARRQPPVGTC